MPKPREWTKEEDDTIRKLCASKGMTYEKIALELHISRNTVIERARKLGVSTKNSVLLASRLEEQKAEEEAGLALDRRRTQALPAGSPLTWSLLTKDPYPTS